MFVTKCFDINVMIRILSNKCIYRFKYMYFSYLYIRTISGSVDYIRVIFVVILAKAKMHIFKYKYTFVFLMQNYHLISVLLPKNLFLQLNRLFSVIFFNHQVFVNLLFIPFFIVKMSYEYSRQIYPWNTYLV